MSVVRCASRLPCVRQPRVLLYYVETKRYEDDVRTHTIQTVVSETTGQNYDVDLLLVLSVTVLAKFEPSNMTHFVVLLAILHSGRSRSAGASRWEPGMMLERMTNGVDSPGWLVATACSGCGVGG